MPASTFYTTDVNTNLIYSDIMRIFRMVCAHDEDDRAHGSRALLVMSVIDNPLSVLAHHPEQSAADGTGDHYRFTAPDNTTVSVLDDGSPFEHLVVTYRSATLTFQWLVL